MIQNYQCIEIKQKPGDVFNLINTMPDKFPTYKILGTTPFLFLRLSLVDGIGSAIKLFGGSS